MNLMQLGNKLLKSTSKISLRKKLREEKYKVDFIIKKNDVFSIKKINQNIYVINDDIYFSNIFYNIDFTGDIIFNRKYGNIYYLIK